MAGYHYNTDILMVGKTGVGKSALGNVILQKKAFKSKNSTESVTKTADFDYCQFDGRILKVVDGPGLGDTDLDPKEAVKLVVDAMSNAICANPKGYHAILLVVRYGVRFTKEDTETVVTLKKIFGEKFITDHAILVMTCGDSFESDAEESKQTFEEWCAEQGGVFGQLYTDVQKRVILFDNKTKEKHIVCDQRQRLLTIIDSIGARYTSKMFEEAKNTRYRLLQGERRLINEDAIREAGLITQLLSRVDTRNPEDGLRLLQDLEKRADLLLEDISKQVKGTKSQTVALKMAQNLKATITDQLEQMQRDYDKMQLEESKQGGRSELKITPEDKCQNARMRRHAKIRQTELEHFKPTDEQLKILQRSEEKLMKEVNERRRQRTENKKRREEEQRAEKRARQKDQIEKRKSQRETEKMAENDKKAIQSFGQLEKRQRAFSKVQTKETYGTGRPEAESNEILTEDLSNTARIRQKEIQSFIATEEHLKMLRREEQRMIKEMQEAEERKRQRAGNKNIREEEEREEEKARKKRQQEQEKMAEERRKTLEDFKHSMAQLAAERERDLQEKVARLENDYQTMKEENLSAWIKGTPTVYSKILSAFGLAAKNNQI